MRGRDFALLLCGAFSAAALDGCRGGEVPRSGPPPRVEKVGAFALDDATLDRFILYETGMPPSAVDPAARDRLYEDLLAEALLARGAERAGTQLAAAALNQEVTRLQGLAGATAPRAAIEQDARRRLLASRYEQTVIAPQVTVAPAEIERALAEVSAAAPDNLVFRQIRTETLADADRAFARLRRGEPFEKVAGELSSSPDRGRPRRSSLAELPEPAAAVLRAAAPGTVTRPVPVDGAYYVFRIEAKTAPDAVSSVRRRDDVRRRLASLALEDARRHAVAGVARQEKVRLPLPSRAPEEPRR